MTASPSAGLRYLRAVALVLVALQLGIGMPITGAAAESGRYHFDEGVSHFRNDELRKALGAFQRARDAGMDTPKLHFNMALTHYKLRNYDRAETALESLADTSGFDAMARYHLGLIAERRGRDAEAARRYQQARDRADTDALRRLTEAGLGRTRSIRETSVYAFAGGGFDGNPSLLNDINRGDTDSDGYLELFGYASHRRGAGIFDASAFLRRYDSTRRANTALLSGSAGRQTAFAGGTLQYRGELAAIRIDDERLQEEYTGRLDWQRALGGSRYLDARLAATRVQADDSYDFLTGWRYRARLRTSGRLGRGWWRTGYRIEFNDRDDLEEPEAFFSRSPIRHRLRLEVGQPLPGPFSLEARLAYRHSRYRDADRFSNTDGSTTEKRRTEDRLSARLGTRWRFGRNWSALLEYEYRDNNSSFDSFAYQRNTLLLGLEWSR